MILPKNVDWWSYYQEMRKTWQPEAAGADAGVVDTAPVSTSAPVRPFASHPCAGIHFG